MSSIQPLYSITTSLQTCLTETIEPPPPGACFVCLRPFAQKDDATDPHEIPCAAVLIQPCGHVVGSACLDAMIRKQGLTRCSYCARPMAVQANPVNVVMRWLLANVMVRYLIDSALLVGLLSADRDLAVHTQRHQDTMIALSHRFFAQQMTGKEAVVLWVYYMKLLFCLLGLVFCLTGVNHLFLGSVFVGIVHVYWRSHIELLFWMFSLVAGCVGVSVALLLSYGLAKKAEKR